MFVNPPRRPVFVHAWRGVRGGAWCFSSGGLAPQFSFDAGPARQLAGRDGDRGWRRAGVADRAGEHGDHVVQGADEGGEGVGAGGFAQVVLGRDGDVGLGAVEVEVVQDGVDVEEQKHDVAGVPGVEGEMGGLVVAAGLADQAHGVHLRGCGVTVLAAWWRAWARAAVLMPGRGAVRTGMSHGRARSYQDRQAPARRGRDEGWRRAGRSFSGRPSVRGVSRLSGQARRQDRDASGPGQVVVDLPGNVALEDPDHLGLGAAFAQPAGHVGPRARVVAQPGDHDAHRARLAWRSPPRLSR